MENARVIIIEDNAIIRGILRDNLEACKHTLVGEAGTLTTAVTLINELQPGDVDVAVVDGNLSRHSEGGFDGERVANLIHKKLGEVIVIGSSLDGEVRGADANVPKAHPTALYDKIASL